MTTVAVTKDLPGTFNIAPGDHTTLRRCFERAGVKVFDAPAWLLKGLSNALFALRLEKMSQGWISLMEYPIIVNSKAFRRASCWEPRYGTEGAFMDCLASLRARD